MAKVTITDFLGDMVPLWWQYSPDDTHIRINASDAHSAVYFDNEGGERIIFKGDNFAYLDGELVQGRVDKIVFQDSDGNTTTVLSDCDFKARQLDNLLTRDSDAFDFFDKIHEGKDTFIGSINGDYIRAGGGNDVIKGRGGDDDINGEAGNDRMTGGAGKDFFYFMVEGKGGQDIVTDFDAKGGGDQQDYIYGNIDDVLSIKQVGDDLVLNYGDGNTLTLRDVDISDLDASDFAIPV